MKITESLKKRFVKDYKIPIKIFADPYFYRRICLLDFQYGCFELYSKFQNMLKSFNNEEEYFEYYTSVKESMMEYIKSTEGYKRFNEADMSQWKIPEKYNKLPSKDIYKDSCIGKKFISIDMIKANFNSLKYFDPTIFINKDTWEDFIRKFTDKEYIINSKYIREVIFGNCNPKRQVTYEKYLMSQLLDKIYTDDLNVVFFSNDEIIIEIDDNFDIDSFRTLVFNNQITPVRMEVFTLKAIMNKNQIVGYIKELDTSGKEFKKINPLYMSAIIRKFILNEEIFLDDLVFEYEDNLCTMLEVPNFTIREV